MDQNILKQRAKAFDYLFDAIVVTDLKGTIIDWNNGAEALYGYTNEEAVGQAVSMLHVPDDIEHVTAEVISAITEFGKWTGEVRMLHKSGRIGWIESMCVPILDDNDKMIGALGINRDISARKTETEHLDHLAHYDQLTEVPNRYLLLDRIKHLSSQADRTRTCFAVLYIDLDKFKQINDTQGHLTGDKILKETASRLSKPIRQSDTIARIGGDEFVVILEGANNMQSISTIANKIIHALDEKFIVDDNEFNISCSIGIAIYPDNGMDAEALLNAAEKAMYNAKNKGRNCYEFYCNLDKSN